MRIARRIYRFALGDVVRLVGFLLLGLLPILAEFNKIEGRWWLIGWVCLFVLKALWDSYLNGLFADVSNERLLSVHGAFAGAIDTITQQLEQSPDGFLG